MKHKWFPRELREAPLLDETVRYGLPVPRTALLINPFCAWCYQRLYSHRSIWRRRPADLRAVLAYLAMSYLYKRSNRYWHQLIRHNLTAAAWRPIVELTRRRHLKFRRRLEGRAQGAKGVAALAAVVVAAGV